MVRLLSDIPWRAKTLALCALFLLLTIAVGSVGGYFIHVQGIAFEQTVSRSQQRTNAATDTRIAILQMDRALHALVAAEDPAAIRNTAIASIRASSQVDENLDSLSKTLPDSPKVAELKALRNAIRPIQVKVIKAAKKQQDASALMTQIAQSSSEIEMLAEQLVAEEYERQAASWAATVGEGRRVIVMLGVIVCSGVLFGLFVSWQASNLIYRPLARVERALAGLAGGDLTIALDHAGRDEVGRTVSAISSTVASLRILVEAIKGEASSVSQKAVSLTDSATNLHRTTELVMQEVDTIETDAKRTHNHSQRAVMQLSEASEQAALAAGTTSRVAREVLDTVEWFRRFESALMETAESTTALAGVAQRITTISNAVRGISQQTNILALNTAIEAARAGDQGQGFAVLAKEIRMLAGDTDNAAREISALVSTISTDARDTVGSLERTLEDAGTSIKTLQSIAFQSEESGDQAEAVRKVMSGVVGLMSEQEAAEQRITGAVSALSELVGKSRDEVKALRSLSSSLNGSSTDLNRSVFHFKLEANADA